MSQSFDRGVHPTAVTEKIGKFVPLFVQLAVKIQPNIPGFLQMPYDYYYPSLSLKLHERTCSFCGSYFASKKFLDQHRKIMHKGQRIMTECSRVCPIDIINFHRCNKEALCIMQGPSTDENQAEWIDIEKLMKKL